MIIDGKFISQEILKSICEDVKLLKNKGVSPGLAVILIGDDPASKVYVKNKKKACDKVGIFSEEYKLPQDTSEDEVLEIINKLNNRKDISGILVQLPLPRHINSRNLIENINPDKDVDAFTYLNVGRLSQGSADILPCTPLGIIEMLKYENIKIEGKHCVVIGRSNIVGKPMGMLLLKENGTVTICHSKTENLKNICLSADILISAVGKFGFVSEDMVREGAVVIDVGMNRDDDGKLCGDVDFNSVRKKASYITPVPGGVGPMTIAMLMRNTVIAAKIQAGLK